MPDRLVEIALDHWGPRFVYRGVDHNDLIAIAARVQSWAGWLDAWIETGDLHARLAADAEAAGRGQTAGEAWVRAALCYHFARFLWLEDEARYLATCELSVTALQRAYAQLDSSWERLEVDLGGGRLAANLRRPHGGGLERHPLVLLIPGLDSTKEEFFHWENVYLARGMATLSLDGPGQGEGASTLPIRADYESAVGAVLDALAGRSDLDLERVAAAGVSLGGYYVARALAFEPRLRAGLAISGPYDAGQAWKRYPPLSRRKATYHLQAESEAEAEARMGELNLRGVAERIRQPLLIVFGDQDRLFSPEGARRLAGEAPLAELWVIEGGNHGVTNKPYLHTTQAADWLREHLS